MGFGTAADDDCVCPAMPVAHGLLALAAACWGRAPPVGVVADDGADAPAKGLLPVAYAVNGGGCEYKPGHVS